MFYRCRLIVTLSGIFHVKFKCNTRSKTLRCARDLILCVLFSAIGRKLHYNCNIKCYQRSLHSFNCEDRQRGAIALLLPSSLFVEDIKMSSPVSFSGVVLIKAKRDCRMTRYLLWGVITAQYFLRSRYLFYCIEQHESIINRNQKKKLEKYWYFFLRLDKEIECSLHYTAL